MLRKIYLLRIFMKPFQGLMPQGESHYQGRRPWLYYLSPFPLYGIPHQLYIKNEFERDGDELKLF
jgi:hypothetical protein